ncbi:UNVERIFIED_CONTAM: Fasciclin-like arabinogalactan protein 2 [Sesamum radiatum]|uniref:Fasciclin-like arabinogalactan protein 2 n=1 Tax=Sesamum radiatum TaxID=300843 RepID=A0AAW2K4B8_SESRA
MKLPVLILSFLLLLFSTTYAHNITRILAQHPDFSIFNHYLTTTHLAAEINRRRTITVCAVDNATMNDLLSKHFSLYTIKKILSLHIFADYFGSNKLHQITKGSTTISSLFQATGEAAGTSGYVKITGMKGGKVGHILSTAAPTDVLNLTSLMAKQGCKAFSDLITAQGADETFTQSIKLGGLTIFCPSDDTLKSFMPRYKNLTADGKTSLLLYHSVPVYNSLGMLRSSKGLMNTLATEGANKFNFTVQNEGEDVKIESKIVRATIKGTLVDEDPLAVYKIDKGFEIEYWSAILSCWWKNLGGSYKDSIVLLVYENPKVQLGFFWALDTPVVIYVEEEDGKPIQVIDRQGNIIPPKSDVEITYLLEGINFDDIEFEDIGVRAEDDGDAIRGGVESEGDAVRDGGEGDVEGVERGRIDKTKAKKKSV